MKPLFRSLAVAIILTIQAGGTAFGERHLNPDEEIKATWTSVVEGHINDAIARAVRLLNEIDPTQDEEAFWRATSMLVEIDQELELDTAADGWLSRMIQTKIAENRPSRFPWMQYYLGRNLVRLGRQEQGVQILKALTANDSRLTLTPAQRSGAIFMSKIEFDRGSIDQSAIWMRRAVIGILVNKDAAPVDILDVLSEYAAHLLLTRRPREALALYTRLEPLYKVYWQKHSPQYIRFTALYLRALTMVGAYAAADQALAELKDAVNGVDVIAPSVGLMLGTNDLYKAARSEPENGKNPVINRLKKLISDHPDILKYPELRITYSYFALLGGDFQLAEELAAAPKNEKSGKGTPLDQADGVLLESLAAAAQKDSPKSLRLAREGVEQLQNIFRGFRSLSSNWSPTLWSEERLVLGGILILNSNEAISPEDKDTLFKIAQLLNSDRSKLGLDARISRKALRLDLQREDLRMHDRLKDLRDGLIDDAVRTLVARLQTPLNEPQSSSPRFDATPMGRLEEIEDKISIVDQATQDNYRDLSLGFSTNIEALRSVLRPNEALVLHNITPFGIVQVCIERAGEKFYFERTLPDQAKQAGIDERDILTAVRAEYAPSPTLDKSFPSDGAFRLYNLLFRGVTDCIKGKHHLILATDPDLFALPFNALLVAPTALDKPFSNRDAAWLAKSYSISMLPSVNSIYELRTNVAPSQAQQSFLGIGNPEFGLSKIDAIRNLRRLPEAATELRAVSTALGAPDDSLLLGPNATERALRSHPLNDYRVISFATHAFRAGTLEGVPEPALILTPGADAYNDGLLTSTKISNFNLDANLVILSACDTAAADGAASGRFLSGLANAFFFAGARSVAVTQWVVESKAAKALSTGLIARSTGSQGVGVAEALQQTMIDYISNTKEDYLAHPRFWAAFVIAGDGAIRPLDGSAPDTNYVEAIGVKNEWLTKDGSLAELTGIAQLGTGEIYAIGGLKPASGMQFSGSYLARLNPSSWPDVVAVDPLIARGTISTVAGGAVLLGYTYSEDRKSGALFRLIANDGKELWRFSEDGPVSDFPIGAIDVPRGYLLVSIAQDFSNSPTPTKLVINLLSTSGEQLFHREYIVSDTSLNRTAALVVKEESGDLIVAINKLRSPAEANLPAWRVNSVTGSHRVCLDQDQVTFLEIDSENLDIKLIADTLNRTAVAMKAHDGDVFVAFSTTRDCRLEHGVELARLSGTLRPETVLKYEGANDIQLWDFITLGDYSVLSGSVRVQLPTTLLREAESLSQIVSRDPFDPAFWEKGEEHASAFVLVGDADGTILGDRVFPDLLNRSINRVVASGPRQIVGVGAALGDRGWMVVLELGATLLNRAKVAVPSAAQH